jgi:hypothetical protein
MIKVAKSLHDEIQEFNALRSPAWRWERACELRNQGQALSFERDGSRTEYVYRYLTTTLDWGRAADPDLHAAIEIYQRGGERRMLIEARILARQSTAEIAARYDLPVEVVAIYEEAFFDVRERLDACDYILREVIGLDTHSPLDPATLLKKFAYFGGPIILELVLAEMFSGVDAGWAPRAPGEDLDACYLRSVVRLAWMLHRVPSNGPWLEEISRSHAELQAWYAAERKPRGPGLGLAYDFGPLDLGPLQLAGGPAAKK